MCLKNMLDVGQDMCVFFLQHVDLLEADGTQRFHDIIHNSVRSKYSTVNAAFIFVSLFSIRARPESQYTVTVHIIIYVYDMSELIKCIL